MATKARVDVVAAHKPSIMPEQVRDARARALRYVFDRYFEKQQAAKIGDDLTEGDFQNGSKA